MSLKKSPYEREFNFLKTWCVNDIFSHWVWCVYLQINNWSNIWIASQHLIKGGADAKHTPSHACGETFASNSQNDWCIMQMHYQHWQVNTHCTTSSRSYFTLKLDDREFKQSKKQIILTLRLTLQVKNLSRKLSCTCIEKNSKYQ